MVVVFAGEAGGGLRESTLTLLSSVGAAPPPAEVVSTVVPAALSRSLCFSSRCARCLRPVMKLTGTVRYGSAQKIIKKKKNENQNSCTPSRKHGTVHSFALGASCGPGLVVQRGLCVRVHQWQNGSAKIWVQVWEQALLLRQNFLDSMPLLRLLKAGLWSHIAVRTQRPTHVRQTKNVIFLAELDSTLNSCEQEGGHKPGSSR